MRVNIYNHYYSRKKYFWREKSGLLRTDGHDDHIKFLQTVVSIFYWLSMQIHFIGTYIFLCVEAYLTSCSRSLWVKKVEEEETNNNNLLRMDIDMTAYYGHLKWALALYVFLYNRILCIYFWAKIEICQYAM